MTVKIEMFDAAVLVNSLWLPQFDHSAAALLSFL